MDIRCFSLKASGGEYESSDQAAPLEPLQLSLVSFSLSALPQLKPKCQKKKKKKGEQAQFRASLLVLAAEVSDY